MRTASVSISVEDRWGVATSKDFSTKAPSRPRELLLPFSGEGTELDKNGMSLILSLEPSPSGRPVQAKTLSGALPLDEGNKLKT